MFLSTFSIIVSIKLKNSPSETKASPTFHLILKYLKENVRKHATYPIETKNCARAKINMGDFVLVARELPFLDCNLY